MPIDIEKWKQDMIDSGRIPDKDGNLHYVPKDPCEDCNRYMNDCDGADHPNMCRNPNRGYDMDDLIALIKEEK